MVKVGAIVPGRFELLRVKELSSPTGTTFVVVRSGERKGLFKVICVCSRRLLFAGCMADCHPVDDLGKYQHPSVH